MPHRPGLAARRFYRTFYQWSILNSRLPAGRYTHAHTHALHSTARADEEKSVGRRAISGEEGKTSLPIKKYHSPDKLAGIKKWGPAATPQPQPQPDSGSGSGPRSNSGSGPGRLFASYPVLSHVEKPFDTFQPQEICVRHRSANGLLVEYALITTIFNKACEKYGLDLGDLSTRTGAHVMVQNISADAQGSPDDRIHSVLVSGNFNQVRAAFSALAQIANDCIDRVRPAKISEEQTKTKLAEDVRASLRSLTHPVVLITSHPGETGSPVNSSWRSARGVTVSSFNTVTLHPIPIITFNLKVPSRSWDAMSKSGQIRIHLLAANSRGAAIANAFTKQIPDAGFLELRKLGVGIRGRRNKPPAIADDQGTVLARLEASLLREKCVTLGDHVVVFAEVQRVAFGKEGKREGEGLAYAMQGYRARGEQVVPEEIVDNDDPLALGAAEHATRMKSDRDATPEDQETSKRRERNATPEDQENTGYVTGGNRRVTLDFSDDPIVNALEATKEAVASGEDLDIYAAMAMGDDDFGDEQRVPWERNRNPYNRRPTVLHSEQGGETGEEDGEAAPQQMSGEFRKVPYSPSSSAPFLGRLYRREFSTLTRSARRSFSTTLRSHRDLDDNKIIDASARNTTVADFLGVPDDNKPARTPRVRDLLTFQRSVRLAEERLESEAETLTDGEIAQIRNTITQQQNVIDRKLAWNAAAELRIMLDKGPSRVDFKRAKWLETCVEKGLGVLLDDAKELRARRGRGEVKVEEYESTRKKLEGDHEVLWTEVMRLRQVVDEDEEGGE